MPEMSMGDKLAAAKQQAVVTIYNKPEMNALIQRGLSPNDVIRTDLSRLVNSVAMYAAKHGTDEEGIRNIARDLINQRWGEGKAIISGMEHKALPTQVNLDYTTSAERQATSAYNQGAQTYAWANREMDRIVKASTPETKALLSFRMDRFSQMAAGSLGVLSGLVPIQDILSAGSKDAGQSIVTGARLVSGDIEKYVDNVKKVYMEYNQARVNLSNAIDYLKNDPSSAAVQQKVKEAVEKLDSAAGRFRSAASGMSGLNKAVDSTAKSGIEFGVSAAVTVGSAAASTAGLGRGIVKEVAHKAEEETIKAVGDEVIPSGGTVANLAKAVVTRKKGAMIREGLKLAAEVKKSMSGVPAVE